MLGCVFKHVKESPWFLKGFLFAAEHGMLIGRSAKD
jgi:hypothetical protein